MKNMVNIKKSLSSDAHPNIRKIPYWKLLGAFVLATVLFSIIFLISYSISYYNYQTTSQQINQISNYLNQINDIAINQKCDDNLLLQSSQILDEVGGRINLLEKRFGKNDQRVLEQKKLYVQVELAHHSIIKRFNKQCRSDFIAIFYFYSNDKENQKKNELTSNILNAFKKLNQERVMIYSFDYNLDAKEINELKEKNKITFTPLILINERDLVNVQNIDDFEGYLKN